MPFAYDLIKSYLDPFFLFHAEFFSDIQSKVDEIKPKLSELVNPFDSDRALNGIFALD